MSYFEQVMSKMESNKKVHGFRYAHLFPKRLSEEEFREISRRFMVVRMPDIQGMVMVC